MLGPKIVAEEHLVLSDQTFVQVAIECSVCTDHKILIVNTYDWGIWKNREKLKTPYVQDLFPNMSKDERELLLSGICGPCFDRVFAEPPEEG